MKKGWKIFWMVCGVTAVTGIACCVAALGMGLTKEAIQNRYPYGIGWVSDDESAERGGRTSGADEEKTFSGVAKIDAEMCAGEVNIYPSDGTEIIVETEGISEKLGFQCYMEDNELKFSTREHLANLHNITAGSVDIYIPKDMRFEEVSLDMGAGSLYIEEIWAQELSVSVGAGEAVIDAFEAADVDFECGAGEITVRGTAGRTADIECGIGSITYTAAGYETDYNYDIECGIGEVICGNNSYSGLAADRMINNQAGKEIHIECGIGSVTIYFEEADAHNGDIAVNREETDDHAETHE